MTVTNRIDRIVPDPDILDALSTHFFPDIFSNRPFDSPVKIWIPGCATGEEVYSFAICMQNHIENYDGSSAFLVLGTDTDEEHLRVGYNGIYAKQLVAEISRAHLDRCALKTDGGYQIISAIRDSCIFGVHSLESDPPFTNLDLIYCGNRLLENGSDIPSGLLIHFHRSLRENGILVFGTSKDCLENDDLFLPIENKPGFYRRVASGPDTESCTGIFQETDNLPLKRIEAIAQLGDNLMNSIDIEKERDLIILSHYAPAYALVNESLDITQFRGHTGDYLEPAPGTPTLNILRMAREGLNTELQAAIQRSRVDGSSVRRAGVKVMRNGKFADMGFEVAPIKSLRNPKDRYFLISFFDETDKESSEPANVNPAVPLPSHQGSNRPDENSYLALQQELNATKEYLQSIIFEKESAIGELRTAVGDVQIRNEELRSMHEDMATIREELQSANEELISSNNDLIRRNRELTLLNNDLVNLFDSANNSAVILDKNLKIRMYTPASEKTLQLSPSDIGKPLSNVQFKPALPDIEEQVRHVINTRKNRETRVLSPEGTEYLVNLRPYKTPDNSIEGAVITLFEKDSTKNSYR